MAFCSGITIPDFRATFKELGVCGASASETLADVTGSILGTCGSFLRSTSEHCGLRTISILEKFGPKYIRASIITIMVLSLISLCLIFMGVVAHHGAWLNLLGYQGSIGFLTSGSILMSATVVLFILLLKNCNDENSKFSR